MAIILLIKYSRSFIFTTYSLISRLFLDCISMYFSIKKYDRKEYLLHFQKIVVTLQDLRKNEQYSTFPIIHTCYML